jgi:hypothetical protein
VRRLTLVLALLGSLLFAASASAHGRDGNRDRIPDRWEKQHGLSLKVKQTSRDQDKDGFRNRAEWRAKTDPHDADSDDDGTDDAAENAGTVTAFDGTTLTVTLFDGGTLSGAVTEDTEIKCDDAASASQDGDDDEGDDDRGGECGGDKGDDDPGDDWDDDEHGDDDGDRHHAGHDDDECGPEALTVGAIVTEAELKISSAGREWREIELR